MSNKERLERTTAIRHRVAWAAAALLVLLAARHAGATPPTPPARLVLPEALAKPEAELAKPMLQVRVEARQAVSDLVLVSTLQRLRPGVPDFEQPTPAPVLERRAYETKELQEGIEIPIKLEEPGEARLDIRLTGRTGPSNGFSDRIVRYVILTPDKRLLLLTPQEYQRRRDAEKERRYRSEVEKNPKSHPIRLLFDDAVKVPAGAGERVKGFDVPPERQLLVRPSGLNQFIKENSVDGTATAWAPSDSITVRGRILFQDIDGVWKPLVNATVNLWDSDFLVDDNLGNVASGWDGRWSFTVNDDDGWLQDGRDIYYTFKLENTRWNVSSCGFLAGPYQWQSAVHNDLPDGTVLDFGDETASTNMDALRVWSTINLAWNHAVTVGGFDPGNIGVCFPGSGTFFDGSNVNIAASDVDGPDSITHEYGHGLMAHAYVGGDPSPGGSHGFDDCTQNKSLSWSEGWATGFMLSVRPDGRYNWHEGDTGRDIENFSSSCSPPIGEQQEGWVAGSLLDMMDTHDDDNGGDLSRGRSGYSDHNSGATVALATMLRDTMVGSHHDDVLAFWSALAGELSSTQRPLGQEIMYYNYMSVLPPISCVATKVAARTVAKPDDLLAGLRRFRDLLLKTWAGGRDWINTYYRNSPELALALLRNPKLVPDAVTVMRHCAALGDLAGNNQQYLAAMTRNDEVLPNDVAQAADRVVAGVERTASAGLKEDLAKVRQTVARLRGMRLQELQKLIVEEKDAGKGKPLSAIREDEFTDASRKALGDRRVQEVVRRGLPQPPAK